MRICSPIRVVPLLLALVGLNVVFAQKGFSLYGTLTDPSGAAVSSAPVQLWSGSGTLIAETSSSATGVFEFSAIPQDSYRLLIPAFKGFAAVSMPVRVPMRSRVLVKLVAERVVQSVTVDSGQSLSIDPSTNKDAVAYQAEDLHSVPVFDQDFIGAFTPFLDPGSIASGGVSIVVDGVEMKASTVSPSAIAEVRVNNDPYSAEFSRPGRGRIEIMTKPGTAAYHGEFNFITRDATFNASNFFAAAKPPEQRRIFEGHLTGPLGRGKHTNFLLSLDSRTDDTYAYVHAISTQGPIAESAPQPRRDNEASFRVTHDFSDAHRLSVGYNFELDSTRNGGVGGLVLPEAGVNNVSREDDLIFNDRIIVSPSIVNQIQVTFEKDEDDTRSVTNAPSIQVDSAFTGGGAQADLARTENTVHINEVVSLTHKTTTSASAQTSPKSAAVQSMTTPIVSAPSASTLSPTMRRPTPRPTSSPASTAWAAASTGSMRSEPSPRTRLKSIPNSYSPSASAINGRPTSPPGRTSRPVSRSATPSTGRP